MDLTVIAIPLKMTEEPLTGCEASVRKARIWSGDTSPSGTVRPLRLRSCVSAVARSCSRATTSPDMPMGAAPPPAGASACDNTIAQSLSTPVEKENLV